MIAQRDNWNAHWDSYAETATANPAQAYRRRLIACLLASQGRPARILDIGSGQGDLALFLHQRFPEAEIRGLELSLTGVEIARRKLPSATFAQWDLLQPRLPPEAERQWATPAVCSEVLEHVDAPEVLLAHASEFLAPGALLCVTVPGGPMSSFDRHIGHRRHYRPTDLRGILERSGFEVRLADGAGFPFFNLYRLAVILRGDRLIQDAGNDVDLMPWTARAAMRVFSGLFFINLAGSSLGWQTVALARKPAGVCP